MNDIEIEFYDNDNFEKCCSDVLIIPSPNNKRKLTPIKKSIKNIYNKGFIKIKTENNIIHFKYDLLIDKWIKIEFR